jgi:hypothetical protein
MLARLVLPMFMWVNTPALADEKIEQVAKQAGELCRQMVSLVKDKNRAYGYCVAEMMRPYVRGSGCITYVATVVDSDPGYYCDANGIISYEPVEPTPAVPTTKEQLFEAGHKVGEKHSIRYAARLVRACAGNNQNNRQGALACLEKGKEKFAEVLTLCMKDRGDRDYGMTDALVRALDRCLEYKLNVAARP